MDTTWLVVGLGNPGSKYANTRHNIGETVLQHIASQLQMRFVSHKTNNQVAAGWIRPGGAKIVCIAPNSYMNLSGGPVKAAMDYFRVPLQQVLVIHDELDLGFGTLRLKNSGGHGGHNGLRDIIKACGGNDFARLRFGIGRPPGQMEVADYVLGQFNKTEKTQLPTLTELAADSVLAVLETGFLNAQQQLHATPGNQ